jgi:hypothetical protein
LPRHQFFFWSAAPAGEFGRALLVGVTPVKLEVDDADHAFADVTDGDAIKLTTADAGGAQILWKEAGSRYIKRELPVASSTTRIGRESN